MRSSLPALTIQLNKNYLYGINLHLKKACAVVIPFQCLANAIADLGRPEDIGRVFAGFQKYLYQEHSGS
ncbi:MAG: hypothetical protein CVV41_22830 [Candidatus Riflebacteria bacterium HGW-Riflebacteria-1]|nr:MAG: hypothetical protein CVV41_22830 [Candidatus Riflebacteria bacterium HGW-Riflebacteria-1]